MISVRNVSKRFGEQVVLQGVSVDIQPGKLTAVVGPSGVGKSVLIKLIMGILDPDIGDVFVFGENISRTRTEVERNRIRGSLGVLFQAAALFDSLSVYDNVAFPLIERLHLSRHAAHPRVVAMLEALGLEGHAFHIPAEIPMGMRKRVGMARALITEPKVLLFDEPNTGLDPLVGQEVYDLINESRKKWGFTGVVISHELPEVFQVADSVIMLLGGRVVFEGAPAEMINSSDPAVQQFIKGRTDGPIKIQ